MNSDPEDNPESTVAHRQKAKNLVRSQYYDVVVKVDEDAYCLDKLQLALKSDYFEQLFVKYSDQEECSLIELPVMDTDTFSAIVDIIYGGRETLTSVLNHDNYVALLMAMDYLQMEIDRTTVVIYANFIEKISGVDVKVFTLYNFVRENPNLRCLLSSVSNYLINHLADMQNNEDFLNLPLDHIVDIVFNDKSDLLKKCKSFRSRTIEEIDSFGDMRKKISRICSHWICYDLKIRLPHAAKLVNAAKRRFKYLNEIKEEDFNSALLDITEEMNVEIMTKLFYKFLLCDGEVIPVIEELVILVDDEEEDIPDSFREKKRRRLLENNYFHDIVVRVEGKTYKLHRFMLTPESGYFAEICSTDTEPLNPDAPTQQPNKSEYFLPNIDQTTFDIIVKYIYLDDYKWLLKCEDITRLLKAANILRMRKLFSICIRWMKTNIDKVCQQILLIDECISASAIADNIERIYSKFIIEREIGNTLPICLVSFDVLEDLLLSSSHCCDDPSKIIDICSKWVIHDVKNRFHLIPQVAFAINRNRNRCKIDVYTDLNNCSEQLIRDELWKALRSTLLVPSDVKLSEKAEKNFHEMPMFIAMATETITIHILNANMEPIASLRLSNSKPPKDDYSSSGRVYFYLAATLMDDNVFFMLSLTSDKSRVFYVYNLRLKKIISLNNNVQFQSLRKYSLLNCRGQVYCCFIEGHVLKYSMELNRWMTFSKAPVRSDNFGNYTQSVWFTSDGDKLYRMYANGSSRVWDRNSLNLHYVVDEFNFQQNAWLSLSDMSFIRDVGVKKLIIVADELTVVFEEFFMSFNQNSRTWLEFSLTNDARPYFYKKCIVLTPCEDGLLHVFGNELYHRSHTNQTWVLKKELPTGKSFPYECITAVHRHTARTD